MIIGSVDIVKFILSCIIKVCVKVDMIYRGNIIVIVVLIFLKLIKYSRIMVL